MRRTVDCSKPLNLRSTVLHSPSEAENLTSEYIIIIVITANREEAEKISKSLLEQKLIACANIIGPVSSSYRRKGKIDHATEHVLLMKSRKVLFDKVEKTVSSLHSYEVPEIVAVQIVNGSKKYLEWIGSVVGKVL